MLIHPCNNVCANMGIDFSITQKLLEVGLNKVEISLIKANIMHCLGHGLESLLRLTSTVAAA